MMSHELRTPLNAIGGYVDLMDLGIHGPLTDAQRESLHRIRRGQQRLLGLINDVLNFARIEAGQVQYRIEDVPVDEVVRGVGSLMEPLIREKGLHYSYVSAPSLAVRADRGRVEQIVLNLLSNAAKFTPESGAIEVTLSESDFVEIQVRATGRGIPRQLCAPDRALPESSPIARRHPACRRRPSARGWRPGHRTRCGLCLSVTTRPSYQRAPIPSPPLRKERPPMRERYRLLCSRRLEIRRTPPRPFRTRRLAEGGGGMCSLP